ncbi:unnamed protein product [Ectocarpus sp. 12 AP-2014]
MTLPTVAALMKQRSVQVVQARGWRAGAELTRLAKWGLPVGAAASWVFYPVINGVYQEYLEEQAEAAAEAAAAAAEES